MTAPTDTRTDVDARRQRARRTALVFGVIAVAVVFGILHAASEWAREADDVLWRRTKLGLRHQFAEPDAVTRIAWMEAVNRVQAGILDERIIAAFLTIIGYSLNDTVVIYDRIREMLRRYKKMPMPQ